MFGLLLSACQSSGPQVPPDSAPVSAPVSAPLSQSTLPASPIPPTNKTAPPEEIARIPEKPPRIYPDPESLKGASISQLIGVMGEPEFIRKDHPAEIWQYRGLSCTLDIFLYQTATGTPHKVDYIETRAKPGGPTSNKECLVSILNERDAPTTTVPSS